MGYLFRQLEMYYISTVWNPFYSYLEDCMLDFLEMR